MNIEPIDRELIVQKIYDFFCSSIISGDLVPGDKLPSEAELSEQFGVGRSTLREAKKMLTSMGVFVERRGSGTFVSTEVKPALFNPMLFSMIIESRNGDGEDKKNEYIYELRVMYETAAMQIVVERATDNQIIALKEEVERDYNRYKNGHLEIEYYLDADIQFHSKIYEMTNNPFITRIGTVISEIYRQGMRNSLRQENGIARSLKNHLKLCDTLLDRNEEQLKKVVEESLEEWKDRWS